MNRPLHQSAVSKLAAQANIERKLTILRDWVTNGIPCRVDEQGHRLLDGKEQAVLEFFPTSVRQFKAWDGSQHAPALQARLPVITATGNDTLAKRPALETQVKQVIAALRQRARLQRDATRHSRVRQLEEELRVARTVIALRVAEVREQQRALRRLQRDHERLQAQCEGDAAEFRRLHGELTDALEKERCRNAQLAAQWAKVRPLRKATHEA
ncbi:hypothetical protein [Dyella japonica]|uniref:Uncharacterized protein n=1 Tax=Dyella japonica DSM 16301 TaxID=1440762 RepID=A0A0G9H9M0_9GAMM|nr:hypothetical protein [Dyella japonica]KLD64397.1 hypothetical protein Y882_07500 [Dyella japonica DSM 16301]